MSGKFCGQPNTISLFDRSTRPALGFVPIIHLLTHINCPPYLDRLELIIPIMWT